MKFAAIDIGSSFTKAAVIDTDGPTLSQRRVEQAPPRRRLDNPYAYEVPANHIFDEVKRIIDESGTRVGGLDGVILATQMHGYVLSGGDSPGEDMYVSWQDARCLENIPGEDATYLDRLRMLFPQEKMRDNGVAIKPSLAMCNLYARQYETGRVFDSEFFTLGSYIISRLTGNNVCHITNAAPTGFVDIRHRGWNTEIIREAGFAGLRFPALTDAMGVCGLYRAPWGETPIYPDVGDQQTATLGCLPLPGEVVANIATAAQLGQIVDRFVPRAEMAYETRPYFEGRFLNTISNMPAGRTLEVFVRLIEEIGERIFDIPRNADAVWKRLDDILSVSPVMSGLESDLGVDPNFYETPDSLPSGAIRNITNRNLTLESLFAATYREMAAIYSRYLGRLCDATPCTGLVFSGGVSWKNSLLTDAIARTAGLPGRRSPMRDEVFLGLARLALVLSGRCETLEQTRGMTLKELP